MSHPLCPLCRLRVVPSDEREQRYERAVTMALHGLSLTLRRLPKDYIAENRADWEQLLSEKKLWKLSKHQNPFVRASPLLLLVLRRAGFCPGLSEWWSLHVGVVSTPDHLLVWGRCGLSSPDHLLVWGRCGLVPRPPASLGTVWCNPQTTG